MYIIVSPINMKNRINPTIMLDNQSLLKIMYDKFQSISEKL